ncbi:hypothetical protein [Cochlodiniinecator piscidefendens]|uniref:hypothetical protein n=1 Tax=Cochlodiniinecator piscidefendens TaxID=2715756 RepID=UPI00140E629D|nr:hypothetical protein [Cochlodiniinecator piscidefendens]
MRPPETTQNIPEHAGNALAAQVRAYLSDLTRHDVPVTYHALAKSMQLSPPNTIHQITMALECLIEEDAAAGHPLIAALVISKTRGGLPAPGFFDSARRVERFGEDPSAFHKAEFDNAVKFWCSSNTS